MKFRLIALILLSTALVACSLAEDLTPPPGYQSPTPQPTIGPLYPSQPPSPSRGAEVYAAECLPCHGENGLGNGPAAAQMPVAVPAIGLREISSQHAPAEWFTVVSQGRSDRGMPSFMSLSGEQRWDVLSYVYSLSATDEQLQRGASLYRLNCIACHGAGGRGDGPQAAGLKPAPTDFTDQQTMSQATGTALYRAVAEGVPPSMVAFGNQLSEDDIWAVVAYLRSLSYDLTAPTATPQPSPTLSQPTANASTELSTTPAATSAEATPAGTTPETTLTGAGLTAPPVTLVTVKGTVTNGSGGSLPAGLTAILHGFTESQETVTLNSPVGPDGSYVFNNVPLTSGMGFLVVVKYGPVEFNSKGAFLDGTTSEYDQPVTIYDSTTDLTTLHIDQVHIGASFSTANAAQFYEIYVMTNTGNQAVVITTDGSSLPFIKIPESAISPSLTLAQGSAPLVTADGGFAFVPGSQQYGIVASFNLPYPNKVTLTQSFVLPVSSLTVFVPEGVRVKGDQLKDEGLSTMQGTSLHLYSAADLAADSSLTMTISGKPGTAAGFTLDTRTGLMIGLGAFGIVLIAVGITLFLRDRSRRMREDEEDEEEREAEEADQDALGKDRDGIADAILALDDQYKAGGIPKEAYEKRRAELKARLKELL